MRRYLGQHFLINKNKIRKIVEALELKDGDVIIEIGPGHGELTDEIVLRFQGLKIPKFKIIVIEKDKKLVEILRNKMALPYREVPYGKAMANRRAKGGVGESIVEIIEGDALKEIKNQISLLRSKSPEGQIKITNQKSKIIKNLKITGNIPYYITGYLLRILGELENKPSLIVLTIQKEVAERICPPSLKLRRAGAKSWKMNLLAASVQFWAEPEIIDYVSRKDFQPAPEVDSAIVKLKPINTITRDSAEKYYKLIKILFKQPRKTILNNLIETNKREYPREEIMVRPTLPYREVSVTRKEKIIGKLNKIGVSPNARPQDLSVEQIVELSTLF